jgi:hypothetical protein
MSPSSTRLDAANQGMSLLSAALGLKLLVEDRRPNVRRIRRDLGKARALLDGIEASLDGLADPDEIDE